MLQAPLPFELTRAAAAAAAAKSSSPSLVCVSREDASPLLCVAAARDCQEKYLLQPSFISHVVPMCIRSESGYSVLYRTICENRYVDANSPKSRIKCTSRVLNVFSGVANGCGRMKFFSYDGDGISEWYEVIICSGKVVSVYLLTGRNYVYQYSSNVGVSLFVTYGVGGISERYRSCRESR